MPVEKIKKFLDESKVKYVMVSHSQAYTAQEIAASSHISGAQLAKTIIIKVNGSLAMAVLPASFQVDFDRLKEGIGGKPVELAKESDFKALFPDCEVGAMPPFGNLYDLDVYVAEKLTHEKVITFNAGTHTELIQLAYDDFSRLVKPKVIEFSGAGG